MIDAEMKKTGVFDSVGWGFKTLFRNFLTLGLPAVLLMLLAPVIGLLVGLAVTPYSGENGGIIIMVVIEALIFIAASIIYSVINCLGVARAKGLTIGWKDAVDNKFYPSVVISYLLYSLFAMAVTLAPTFVIARATVGNEDLNVWYFAAAVAAVLALVLLASPFLVLWPSATSLIVLEGGENALSQGFKSSLSVVKANYWKIVGLFVINALITMLSSLFLIPILFVSSAATLSFVHFFLSRIEANDIIVD